MTSHALGAFHRLPREIRERTWDAYLDLCHINDQGYAGSKDSILNLMTMSKAIRADCKKVYDFHYWRQASLDLGLEGYHVLGDVTRYVFWLVLHDCTRINASIASLRLATPDLRPDDPPPLNGLRHVRKLVSTSLIFVDAQRPQLTQHLSNSEISIG